ncbi:MAG: ABC transporter ATP-binding protein [Aminobacteriaceae bacterium]
MFLRLERLDKRFGGTEVVRGLSLDVERGEMLSLLGPSGCGKTTTLRMVGGFLRPDGGRVVLDGEEITTLPPERRPTATVFQSYALFPHMTVLRNVIYGLKFRKVPREQALSAGREMLEKVGLPGAGGKTVDQLSGGEQQRVALARALIVRPKVLLLDEPLSNLDVKLRVRMRGEIRRLQREFGITALYVTHDQEEALALSDRVAVMEGGRIVQIGSPREVYGAAANSFVADFIGRSNILSLQDGSTVAVHPEDIRLSRDDEGIEGVVFDRQFKGAVVTWFIEAGGRTVEADVSGRLGDAWAIGERVRISFDRESATTLNE